MNIKDYIRKNWKKWERKTKNKEINIIKKGLEVDKNYRIISD